MARFGNIGKQYFDNSGYPLIAGKLYFYQSGTSTLKTTYADVNLSIPNTNPVILTAAGRQPNVFFNGSARVVLTDENDVQIEVRDPDGATESGNFDAWNSITIYNTSDIVVGSDGAYYKSITDANQGNDPTSSPTEWQQIEFLNVWNSSETYAINATVKASNGLFYKSLVNGNIGNNPISSPTEWGPVMEIPPINDASSRQYAFDNFFGL
jgi:hypothetical protein